MRIAIVLPGGVDRSGTDRIVPVFVALIARLARRHDVHVFALRHEPIQSSWPLCGAHVHNIGTERGRGRRFLTCFGAEHARAPFDVVHAFFGWEAAYAAVACARHRVPLLFHATGGEFVAMPEAGYGMQQSLRGRLALRFALARAGRVTVATSYMEGLAESCGARAHRVPLGVPLDVWPVRAPVSRDRARAARLLHVGDLRLVKDQATLLEAVRQVRAAGHDVALDMVGADTMHGTLQASAVAKHLGASVRWHGVLRRDALRELIERAHVLVMTSRHEAGEIVTLEAAIAGVPTVGTNVGTVAEFAPSAAVAVPVGDARALAAGIIALLEDDARRVAIARCAQARAVAINADVTAAMFERHYADLVVAPLAMHGDPFTNHAPLPFADTRLVTGLPVRFASNSRHLLRMACEGYPAATQAALARDATPLSVRVSAYAGDEACAPPAPLDIRVHDGHRLTVRSVGSQATCDPDARRSVAHITTALAADRVHCRRELLDTITLGLIAPFDRHPVHAAAVVQNGFALLLAGASGAGKSTLAYAAACDGMDVLSDDLVWVQMQPSLCVWGSPRGVRLTREAAVHLSRDVATHDVTTHDVHAHDVLAHDLAASDSKTVVEWPHARTVHHVPAKRAAVCLLTRGTRNAHARVERVSADELAATLHAELAPGFDRFPERVGDVIAALTAPGGWRLTLSSDVRDALPMLRDMLEAGRTCKSGQVDTSMMNA